MKVQIPLIVKMPLALVRGQLGELHLKAATWAESKGYRRLARLNNEIALSHATGIVRTFFGDESIVTKHATDAKNFSPERG